MAEPDTPPKRAAQAPAAGEILPNFADLVVGMSRLLLGFAHLRPFRNAGLSMADWVALSVLAQGPATNNRQLAKALGVTRQRANQIKTSLERNKLISATQSSEDARQNVITLTSRGQAQLGDINEKILTVLSSSLKEKKGALLKANSSVRILLRMVRAEAGGNERPARARVRRRKLAARSAGTGI